MVKPTITNNIAFLLLVIASYAYYIKPNSALSLNHLNSQHRPKDQTIHIGHQPIYIKWHSQSSQPSQYTNKYGIKQQLQQLKNHRMTINNPKAEDHSHQNRKSEASLRAQNANKIDNYVQRGRIVINNANQNILANMKNALNYGNRQVGRTVNQVQDKYIHIQDQTSPKVITIGTYTQQNVQYQNPSVSPATQQTITMSRSQENQPNNLNNLQLVSGNQNIQMSNDNDFQALRASFIQNHRNRVTSALGTDSQVQNNLQVQSQGNQDLENENSIDQTSLTRQRTQNVRQNARDYVNSGSASLKQRINNLEAQMLARQRRKILSRLNQHQILVGANQNPFARFRGTFLSTPPSRLSRSSTFSKHSTFYPCKSTWGH